MAVKTQESLAQLMVVSGGDGRHDLAAEDFPVMIGRAKGCEVSLKKDGVWDEHVSLSLSDGGGFVLRSQGKAATRINGEALESGRRLRNGDVIAVGSVKLQFWLGRPRQRALEGREMLFWVLLLGVLLAQAWMLWKLG